MPACSRFRRRAKAELERIESLAVLQGEAILQSLSGVAANDVRNAAGRVAQQHGHELEVGEFVAGREQRVRLRGALELFDLDQRLVADARRPVGGINRAAFDVHFGPHAPERSSVLVAMAEGFGLIAPDATW